MTVSSRILALRTLYIFCSFVDGFYGTLTTLDALGFCKVLLVKAFFSDKHLMVENVAANRFPVYITELKECSLWIIYSKRSPLNLRDPLGGFFSCKTTYKWAARIGQCFSTLIDHPIISINTSSPAAIGDSFDQRGK
jgi:hypothetical protein